MTYEVVLAPDGVIGKIESDDNLDKLLFPLHGTVKVVIDGVEWDVTKAAILRIREL